MAAPVVTGMLHPTRAGLLRAAQETAPSGTVMLLSWKRLAEELKRSGAISSTEVVTHFVVEDGGVNLHLERAR